MAWHDMSITPREKMPTLNSDISFSSKSFKANAMRLQKLVADISKKAVMMKL